MIDTLAYLQTIAGGLAGGGFVKAGNDYERSSLATYAGLAFFCAQDLDRAAERLVEENAALRELFREAAGEVADAALAGELRAAAASEEPGLRVSALKRRNDEWRSLLIGLHAHVEGLDTPGARRVDDAIWRELARSVERLEIPLPGQDAA